MKKILVYSLLLFYFCSFSEVYVAQTKKRNPSRSTSLRKKQKSTFEKNFVKILGTFFSFVSYLELNTHGLPSLPSLSSIFFSSEDLQPLSLSEVLRAQRGGTEAFFEPDIESLPVVEGPHPLFWKTESDCWFLSSKRNLILPCEQKPLETILGAVNDTSSP